MSVGHGVLNNTHILKNLVIDDVEISYGIDRGMVVSDVDILKLANDVQDQIR